MSVDRLVENLAAVRGRIEASARRSGRDPSAVRLVAVTKMSPIEAIRPLIDLGAADLGENYPQDLWKKAEALADLDIRWHMIGHLQRNKARRTFDLVRLIHAVDSLRLLRHLDDLAGDASDPPAVCLQVNCSGEVAKHGWSPSAILEDAEAIASFLRLPVVGLMTMAAVGTTAAAARPAFVKLREVRDILRNRTGLALHELSMGMTNDFEVAIEEGATWVRIGSALFEGVEL
jgi:pyridoxal phosphate enzyme (YggS family)